MANDTGPGGQADRLNQVSGGAVRPPESGPTDSGLSVDSSLNDQSNNPNPAGNSTSANTGAADASSSGGQSSYESGSWAIDTSSAVAGNSPSTVNANADATSSGGQSSYESGSWAIDTSSAIAGDSPSTTEASASTGDSTSSDTAAADEPFVGSGGVGSAEYMENLRRAHEQAGQDYASDLGGNTEGSSSA